MTTLFSDSPDQVEVQTNPLRDLVRRRLDELDISIREAARRSQGGVSHERLSQILRGKRGSAITPSTIKGIAAAIGVPARLVWDAAELSEPDPWDMSRYNSLSPRQREIVEAVAAGYLEANKKAAKR